MCAFPGQNYSWTQATGVNWFNWIVPNSSIFHMNQLVCLISKLCLISKFSLTETARERFACIWSVPLNKLLCAQFSPYPLKSIFAVTKQALQTFGQWDCSTHKTSRAKCSKQIFYDRWGRCSCTLSGYEVINDLRSTPLLYLHALVL